MGASCASRIVRCTSLAGSSLRPIDVGRPREGQVPLPCIVERRNASAAPRVHDLHRAWRCQGVLLRRHAFHVVGGGSLVRHLHLPSSALRDLPCALAFVFGSTEVLVHPSSTPNRQVRLPRRLRTRHVSHVEADMRRSTSSPPPSKLTPLNSGEGEGGRVPVHRGLTRGRGTPPRLERGGREGEGEARPTRFGGEEMDACVVVGHGSPSTDTRPIVDLGGCDGNACARGTAPCIHVWMLRVSADGFSFRPRLRTLPSVPFPPTVQ